MWDALDDTLEDAKGHDQAGGDAGEHCLVKNRFVKTSDPDAREHLAKQVFYIAVPDQRDPPDREPRALFTDGDTDLSRKEARAMIWSNRSAKSAAFHRIILSPSTGLGIKTAAEAREWTRTVMRDLAVRLDRELTWVAATHTNRSHAHVHVLVAGEAGQASTGGARRVVRFSRDDIKALRERITIDAARPIREATQAQARATARAAQDAQRAALYERLGVPIAATPPSPTPPSPTPPTAPAAHAIPLVRPSQAGRKRHWWQRGTGG